MSVAAVRGLKLGLTLQPLASQPLRRVRGQRLNSGPAQRRPARPVAQVVRGTMETLMRESPTAFWANCEATQ